MSEINEDTMKEFFQSVVDKVATLSSQAAKVEGLEQRINDLYQRINQLEQDNAQLRSQLSESQAVSTRLETELNDTKSSLEVERNTSGALRDTIVSRDTRVSELTRFVDDTNQALHVVSHERDEARNELNDVRAYNDSLKEQLNTAREQGQHWQSVASDFERKVHELEDRLARINAILGNGSPSNVVGFAQTA